MKLSSTLTLLCAIIMSALFIQGCNNDRFDLPDLFTPEAAPPPYDSTFAVSDSTLKGGTNIYVVQRGHGHFQVVYRDEIRVRITGRTAKGEIFRTSFSKDKSLPDAVTLANLTAVPIIVAGKSVNPLIEGLRRGLLGMKEGEKRIIKIPPSMGFTNPARKYKHGVKVYKKTLVYNVKLIDIL